MNTRSTQVIGRAFLVGAWWWAGCSSGSSKVTDAAVDAPPPITSDAGAAGDRSVAGGDVANSREAGAESGAAADAAEAGGGAGTDGGDAGGAGADGAMAACRTLGSAWTVVDDYVYSPTTNNTNPSGLSVSPGGTLHATGIAVQMGQVFGLIRRSADGLSWSLLKEMQGGLGSGPVGFAPDGTMFAAGSNSTSRVVHRSKDSGVTWQEVDGVAQVAGSPCNTGDVAVDSKGVVYSAGSCDTEGWRVRRSSNGGDAWAPVGDAFKLAGPLARQADLHIDLDDRVFVSGTAQDGSGGGHWIVRRLAADGTWTIVDDYLPEATASTNSPRLTGSRRLYALGTFNGSTAQHWIIRRAEAGGSSWTTIDDWVSPGAMGIAAVGLHEGPNGLLVSVGSVTDGAGVTRAITRRSSDDGKTWMASEEWAYAPGKDSTPGKLIADSRGNVYTTVRAVDAAGRAHWLVRRLACSP
jgi:hypothetical protein